MILAAAISKGVFWGSLVVLTCALVFLVLRATGRAVARKRARLVIEAQGVMTGTDQEWPDTAMADSALARAQANRPKAPQIGYGLPTGVRK